MLFGLWYYLFFFSRPAPRLQQNQIRAEYKRLALQYHPDKNKGHTEQYQKIKEAYDVLGDPERRAVYDRWRQSGLAVPFADYLQTASLSQASISRQQFL